ncbi:Hypothetical protein PBC10988_28580 [Planctomycetales bacterium 10988]|nr:Hypothetical protein PBC10988_28580 [Planctomycetales bacterium 10988]
MTPALAQRLSIFRLPILLGLLLSLAGCSPEFFKQIEERKQHAEYFRQLSNELNRLTTIGENYIDNLNPWLQGRKLDVDQTKVVFEEMVHDFEDIKANIKALKHPDEEPIRGLEEDVFRYLELEGELLLEFREILIVAIRNNPGSFKERKAAEDKIFAAAEPEKKMVDDLNKKMIDTANHYGVGYLFRDTPQNPFQPQPGNNFKSS